MSKSQTFTAGCSAVGGFGYAGNFTLYVVLTDRDGNSSTNVSQVDYNVYCQSNGSGSISAKHLRYFSINGSEKINTTGTINVSSPYAYISIASGTISVTHNNDGTATIPFSAQIKASSYGVSASVSGNFELEKIARYTTVTNSVRDRSINTISVNWVTTDARDHTQYSLNGGTWTDAKDTVASNNKSGYYTVSGLNPNTSYSIKTRCRRTDSQLWSEASALTISTYNIATITEAPNFTDEQSPTIKYTNPFGNNVTSLQACISLTGAKDDIVYRDIPKTGTSYTFNLTDAERNVLRKAATKNTLSVKFFIKTEYNKVYTSSTTRTMSIINANPIFSNFTYQDTNATTIALTGNNQTIIKGYSNVKGIVSTANKATARKSAIMSRYRLAIEEKTAEVAYSSSEDVSATISAVQSNSFTMYAIDSRENSTGKTITASTYINYTPITITSISVVRTNNVTPETTLKFSGKIWNGSFGSVTNSIKSCSYKYKLSSASSWTIGTTTINPTKSGGTFSFTDVIAGDLDANGFNIDNSYNIQVLISDELSNNNSNPASFTLGPGTPAVAIYKNNAAIGQKYDTSDGSKLQVNGSTKFKDVTNLVKNSGEVGYYAKRGDTGTEVWVGVGSGGINHGVYSKKLNKWIVYSDDSNVYLNGVNSNKFTPVSLYDNSSGTNGSVTLSETAANFSYLEIYYGTSSQVVIYCSKVYSPNGKTLRLVHTGSTYIYYKDVEINGTSITVDSYKSILIQNGTNTTNNVIYIFKVVGYR